MLPEYVKMTNRTTNILIKELSLTADDMENIKYQLSKLNWSMFLESASLEHIDSNWSIYTADPIATLVEHEGSSLFSDLLNGSTSDMGKDPLTAQQNIRQKLFHSENIANTPFTGGVIAAYHYEMGELFETLRQNQTNIGVGLGRFHCGFYDWAILYNLKKQQYFLIQHQTKNQDTDLEKLWTKRCQWLTVLSENASTSMSFSLVEQWKSNYTELEYHHSFNKIQDYILSGDCYQVNFAQRFQAKYKGDEYQAYQALLKENKAPFASFIRLPEQVIISVSPERLLLSKSNQVQSKPIKGTMPRSADEKIDLINKNTLLNSEKDKAENLMIVDLLRNDIGKVCKAGSVSVPKLFDIETFPAVHHLVSTVTGLLNEHYSSEDLLRACFPGGSITGAPKIRAMEIICELEKYQREIYCGSIAYINGNGDMDSSITIRTLVCNNQNIYCWAGGGIVADSNVESEYQECFDKVSKILPVLAELNQPESY